METNLNTTDQHRTIIVQQHEKKSKSFELDLAFKIIMTFFLVFLFVIICLIVVLIALALTGKLNSSQIITTDQMNQTKNTHKIKLNSDLIILKTNRINVREMKDKLKQSPKNITTIKLEQNFNCGLTYYQNSISLSRISRIVNGIDAIPHSQPWIVSIRSIRSNGLLSEHQCGGSLITDQYVLTAAHCVESSTANSLAIIVGINELSSISQENLFLVENFWIHEQYSGSKSQVIMNDIALIKLDQKVTFTDKVQYICLPSSDESVIESDLIASGWGNVYDGFESQAPEYLQTTKLRVINNSPICDSNGPWDSQGVLCALEPSGNPNSNVCFGDSGGPLVRKKDGRWTLYGITSYVLVDRDRFGRIRCLPDKPSYFTNVARHVYWVSDRLQL